MLLSFLVRCLEGKTIIWRTALGCGMKHVEDGGSFVFFSKTKPPTVDLLTQANRFSLEMVPAWFALLIP